MGLKTKLMKAALTGMSVTGAAALLSPLTGGRGVILTLHHVRPRPPAAFAPNAHLEISPSFLAGVVGRIRKRGMEIVSLSEAKRRLDTGEGGRFAVLTFDDGYRDNLLHALPVLKPLGAPFTVYVASGLIDRTATPWWIVLEHAIARQDEIAVAIGGEMCRWHTRTPVEKQACFDALARILTTEVDEDTQRAVADDLGARYGADPKRILANEMMTWDELRRLAAEPLVTIGAHTAGHYALARLPLQRAAEEVLFGARRLERELGAMPKHFSYPYGYASAATPRDFALLADLGFATAVTTVPGMLSDDSAGAATALPRVSLNGHFQRLRYVDVFLSGAPFALRDLAARFRRRRPLPVDALPAAE